MKLSYWLKIRDNELHFYRSKFQGEYPYWVNLDKLKRRIKGFRQKDDYGSLKTFIEIEEKLINLDADISAAFLDYEIYSDQE
jgi:hypothetical protein